jgi:hypothetical protein
VRATAERERIERLLVALGRRVRGEHTLYLAGGSSAVIEGWRQSTIDVDLRPEPDSDELLRALSALKDELDVNVETASPLDFLPPLAGWREHSPYVASYGSVHVRHMDFRLQALAKLERASEQDLEDVSAMLHRGLVTTEQLIASLAEMEPSFYRFPALDGAGFTRRVRRFVDRHGSS